MKRESKSRRDRHGDRKKQEKREDGVIVSSEDLEKKNRREEEKEEEEVERISVNISYEEEQEFGKKEDPTPQVEVNKKGQPTTGVKGMVRSFVLV